MEIVYDFGEKVIEAIELDDRKKCEIFKISCNTVDLWLKRQAGVKMIAACGRQLFAALTILASNSVKQDYFGSTNLSNRGQNTRKREA